MRQTHYIGLTDDAKEFLEDNNAELVMESPASMGIFDEHVLLKIWVCKFANHDDMMGYSIPYEFYYKTYVEVVQEVPWSSGPVIFTCLLDTSSGTKQYLWAEEKINEY